MENGNIFLNNKAVNKQVNIVVFKELLLSHMFQKSNNK